MTSTFQLQVGLKASKATIMANWLKYTHDSGHSVKVSQNSERPKSRYFSVCYSAPKSMKAWNEHDGCKAHIKCVGDTSDQVQIVSLNLVHTCQTLPSCALLMALS